MKAFLSQSIATVLSLALVTQTIGCGSVPSGDDETPINPTEEAAQAATFSGEDVFLGIYFGEGPVGDMMPALWEKLDVAGAQASLKAATKDDVTKEAEAQLTAARASTEAATRVASLAKDAPQTVAPGNSKVFSREQWRTAIITSVKAADPTFFERFGSEMQSGDHVRVAAAMEDGTNRFLQAMSAPSGGASGNLVQPLDPTPGNVNYVLNVNIYVVAAVAIVAAAAVLVIVVFAKPARPGGLSGLEPDAQLQRDIAVDYFVNQLGG